MPHTSSAAAADHPPRDPSTNGLAGTHETVEARLAESLAAQRRLLQSANATRRQLARDLHDGAQQRLVNLLIRLQLASEHVEATHPTLQQALDAAAAEAKAAIAELRQVAAGLHPSILTTRGLHVAVQALAARTVVPTQVSATIPARVSADVEASAYFLIAEALTNVVKHAHAQQATVLIDDEQGWLAVHVTDDGVGGAAPRADCAGLSGMADRATALGGTLHIESPRGAGTRVRARLPLDTTIGDGDRRHREWRGER
ncbi:two-component system sensor kinase [Mycobacteroides abscessus subsp. abscessus]|nr:histidine kinase [Mycobacteroides abscessus]SIL73589.1 two-component system sensor kinase [Mycobacteroides abscessus subsp. abscessus]